MLYFGTQSIRKYISFAKLNPLSDEDISNDDEPDVDNLDNQEAKTELSHSEKEKVSKSPTSMEKVG